MRLLRAQLRASQLGGRVYDRGGRWSATVASLALFAIYVLSFQDGKELKTDVHLTCAQVIGAALALILSLSIIPAQRAAEALSPAVLRLYARDHWLIRSFVILALTTAGSVLLGTNVVTLDPRVAMGVQFLMLGVSFDAMRHFQARTLQLLEPQTAIQFITHECAKQVNKVSRVVERLARIQELSSVATQPPEMTRWVLFSASNVPASLRVWIGQLEEIAHKQIAIRDTSAARDVVTAISHIARQYTEARRKSLVLVPDWSHPLAGGTSDIAAVLNPAYESIRHICEDAARATNEQAVTHCLVTFTEMTKHALTVLHSPHANTHPQAPLSFSPCFYLGECATTAIQHGMADAVLAAVRGFQSIALSQNNEVNTVTVRDQCLDSLMRIALAGYGKTGAGAAWVFPAVRAMMLIAAHDIQLGGYHDVPIMGRVFANVRTLTPFEVAMEKAGQRQLEIFPPYDLSFEASGPILFEMIAQKVTVDVDRPWVNPFHDFEKAAEAIRHHYRTLAGFEYDSPLLRKWIIDSLIAAARVHVNVLGSPPANTEDYLFKSVEEPFGWLISWIPRYFAKHFNHHHVISAVNALACLGISLLELDRRDAASNCGKTLAAVAATIAEIRPEPYLIADIHERIEILARAADVIGKPRLAVRLREMIQKPGKVRDEDWPEFLEARETRLGQLDERLDRYGREYSLEDDPVVELRRLMRETPQRSPSAPANATERPAGDEQSND